MVVFEVLSSEQHVKLEYACLVGSLAATRLSVSLIRVLTRTLPRAACSHALSICTELGVDSCVYYHTTTGICEMLSIYPAITNAEFGEAIQILEHAYAASLDVTGWVEVRRGPEAVFIRQRRTSLRTSRMLGIEVTRNKDQEEECHNEIEQEDEESLQRNPSEPSQDIFIDFSIVLSPTYQVPVLWFQSISIPVTRADALDRVYEEIVSPASRTGLRQIGVLGGISMAEHPISGLPAFFIHPCRTQEALKVVQADKNISPVDYMMLWFGIIASPVGLSLPLGIAESISTPGFSDGDRLVQPKANDGHDA